MNCLSDVRRYPCSVWLFAVVLASGVVAANPGDQAPASASPQSPQVFRGGVNYVLVDAYPQRAGTIVEGLTAADFQVLEDGKPQTIDVVEFVRVEGRQPDSAFRDPNTVREMIAAAADPHARVFVVFLDTAHTAVDGSQRIRAPLVATLDGIMTPSDLFGIITQNQRPSDLTLQRRMLSVEDQLSRNWPWGMSQRVVSDRADPMEDMLSSCFRTLMTANDPPKPWVVADGAVMRAFDKVLIERRREDRLLTSLSDLITYLASIREARTVLMMVTDGWLLYTPNRALENEPIRDLRFGSVATPQSPLFGQSAAQNLSTDNEFRTCVGELNRLTSLDDQRRFRDVIALAQRSNVSIYPVSSAGLSAVALDLNEPYGASPNADLAGPLGQNMTRLNDRVNALKTLAENTDGLAVVDSNDLASGMKRIVDDVSAYYLIGYYTTNPKADGKFRKIDVKMKAPGMTVHARRGYVAASAESARSAPAPGAAEAAANAAPVEAALASLAREGAATDLFIHGSMTGEDLTIAIELGTRPMSSGDWAKGGKVTVEVASENGTGIATGTGAIDPGMRGTLVKVPVGTAAGPWKVTVKAASGLSSLSDGVSLSASQGVLLGDPVVSRATPSPRSPLLPVANFEFRRNERVHVEWLVLKTLDDRTARVLDRKGQPLPLGATLTERALDGKTAVAVDVNLAPLAEGDYVIEVTATNGADHERKLVAVRVVR